MPTLTTFVDGTVPVAADFNNNFNSLNGVCGTGTAISTYVAGDTLYASGVNTLSKLPIGTTGQVYTVSGGVPVWAAASGAQVTNVIIHEDFLSPLDTLAAGAAAARRLPSGIYLIGPGGAGLCYEADPGARGIIGLIGDAANLPTFLGPYSDLALTTLKLAVKASDSPTLTFRVSNAGANNNTKRIGAAATTLTVDPANGIFIRWAAAGNLFAVCRAAGVESTLDTGLAPSATSRVVKFTITASLVTVFVDDVNKGTIATNIPSVGLGLAAGVSTNVNTDGMYIDFFDVAFTR